MKHGIKQFLSLFLGAALVLGLGTAALADTAVATGVTLNQSSATLYLRSGTEPQLTLTATPRPSDYTGRISWTSSGSTSAISMSAGSGNNITVTGLRTGVATVTAAVTGSNRQYTASCTVTVANDEVENRFLDKTAYSVRVGETVQVTPVTRYKSGYEENSASCSVDNTSIATITRSGALRGIAEGSTLVRAVFSDGTVRTATVSVGRTGSASGSDVSDTVTAGETLSLHKIYNDLALRFSNAGGNTHQARISIPHVGNANYGLLYETPAMDSRIENGYEGPLSAVDQMCFMPGTDGNCDISYTITDGAVTINGTITIRVEIQSKNIGFTVEETGNYSFSASSRDGETAVNILNSTLGGYGSIRFGAVTSGSSVGTLYRDSVQTHENLVTSGTIVDSADADKLFFVPSRSGVYRVAYTAYGGAGATGGVTAAGAISITVGANSLDVTINLDSVSSYRFSSGTRRNAESGGAILRNAIDSAVGGAWSYLRFDQGAVSGAQTGVLYERSSAALPISSDADISYRNIDELYFEPARAGTFEIGYGVYSDSGASSLIATGTLRIVVPSIPYGSLDLWYSVSAGGTVALSESDFERWFQSKRDSRYVLSHVVFDEYENDYGSFYHDSDAFTPYNSPDFHTSSYTGSGSAGTRYLNHVTFAAPGAAGYQAVKFTCYGTNGSSGGYVQNSGALYIFVTEGDVPSIHYNVAGVSSLTLKESDFIQAYQTATRDSAERPQYYIQLLGIPSRGTLYYDATGAGRSNARITAGNMGNYNFYVNGGSARNSIRTLSYVPANSSSVSDTVPYIAYSSSGRELYTGTINFRYTAPESLSAASDGYLFSSGDFGGAASGGSIRYVVFRQPASGKLYVNYANGKGTLVPAGARFYLDTALEDAYPVSSLCYIPRAGATGSVFLDYTVCTGAGTVYDDVFSMELIHKTESSVFSDITAYDVGSWAADAIDYANRWGLVKGTSAYPPFTFSPRNTMQRCDLVLILYRIAGSPAVTGSMAYPDVPSGAYYYESALWASRNNLMAGVIQNGRYDPAGQITRQDFATILYNYTRSAGISTANNGSLRNYRDAGQVGSYAVDAMTWAVAKGYITSTSTTELLLSPAATATRAEIATLLHRYLTY